MRLTPTYRTHVEYNALTVSKSPRPVQRPKNPKNHQNYRQCSFRNFPNFVIPLHPNAGLLKTRFMELRAFVTAPTYLPVMKTSLGSLTNENDLRGCGGMTRYHHIGRTKRHTRFELSRGRWPSATGCVGHSRPKG